VDVEVDEGHGDGVWCTSPADERIIAGEKGVGDRVNVPVLRSL
jgi:hypothetical protein